MRVVVVGVDPGAEHTGIVAAMCGDRVGSLTLHTHRTIERGTKAGMLPVEHTYIERVLLAVGAVTGGLNAERLIVGVEGVRAPSMRDEVGKRKPFDPEPLIATAYVAGVVMGVVASTDGIDASYLVEPGGNGHAAYGAYPMELVSPAERRAEGWVQRPAGQGIMRHVRSGYDVARMAERLDRPHRRQG